MYVLFILLGILGIGGIAYLIFGKLKSLSLIDIEKAVPKSKKIKEAILTSRLKRILTNHGEKHKNIIKIISENTKYHFERMVDKLLEIEAKTVKKVDKAFKKEVVPKEKQITEKEKKIKELLEEAEQLAESPDIKKTEGKYIEVIKQDSKNVDAYQGLGKLYLNNGQNKEAQQIFEFLLKLGVETAELYINIANLAWEDDNLDEAKTYYLKALSLDGSLVSARVNLGLIFDELNDKEAATQQFKAVLELEPKNPRYLDLLIESSIKIGDKDLAKQALSNLEAVNPENKKIKEFKKKIKEM